MLPVTVGNGGWVRFVDDDGDAVLVRAKLTPDGTRVFISDLERPDGFAGDELTRLDLGGIQQDLNAEPLRSELLARITLPGIDLATASDYFFTSFARSRGHWVADMLWSQVKDSGVPVVPRRPPAGVEQVERRQVNLLDEAKIEDPGGRPRPDAFYLEVLEVQRGLRRIAPWRSAAEIIARANGVPKTTVERWLRRAGDIERERG
jgi:hypothetical protein